MYFPLRGVGLRNLESRFGIDVLVHRERHSLATLVSASGLWEKGGLWYGLDGEQPVVIQLAHRNAISDRRILGSLILTSLCKYC